MNKLFNEMVRIKDTNDFAIKIGDEDNNSLIIPSENIYLYPDVISIDSSNIEKLDNNAIRFNLLYKCKDCGYIGNVGLWKGIVKTKLGNIPIEDYIKLTKDNTWNTEEIFPTVNYYQYTGDVYCPICKSKNFY